MNAQYTETHDRSAKKKVHSIECLQKELEKLHTSNSATHLKALEQEDANTLKRNKRQKIIKQKAKINNIESKRTTQ